MTQSVLANVSCVAVAGRALLIEGPPGSGKSSLALALIDRGAALVGDDGVTLERRGDRLWAHPPPHIAGKLEIRGVGIVDLPATSVPVCLLLALRDKVDRLPDPEFADFAGIAVPRLAFDPLAGQAAARAEWALRLHGLPLPPRLA